MTTTIFSAYDDIESAGEAVDNMISNPDVDVVHMTTLIGDRSQNYVRWLESRPDFEMLRAEAEADVTAAEGAAFGALAGLAIGLGIAATAFAPFTLPVIGPVIGAGPLVSALTGGTVGVAAGAATGGFTAGLIERGVHENDVDLYAQTLTDGGVVIVTEVFDEDADKATALLDSGEATVVTRTETVVLETE